MHDCPKIQEKLLDLVFNEIEPHEQKQLLDELALCAFCRAELESVEKTLVFYDRAAAFIEPSVAEWQTLENNLQKPFKKPKSVSVKFWRQIIFGTVRVPAPVLAAAAVFVCGAAFFAFRSTKIVAPRQQIAAEPAPTSAAQNSLPNLTEVKESREKSQEKIVVREVERVVTRKIYVVKQTSSPKQPLATVAKIPAETSSGNLSETESNQLNLAEFKPIRPAATPSAVKENKP